MTPNDLASDCADGLPDCDSGLNGLQNFPVLDPPSLAESGLLVLAGTLASRPERTHVVELFANRTPGMIDEYGEGELFVGALRIETDATGSASFSLPVEPAAVLDRLARRGRGLERDYKDRGHEGPVRVYFTATATDASAGATSEFSHAVQALWELRFGADV